MFAARTAKLRAAACTFTCNLPMGDIGLRTWRGYHVFMEKPGDNHVTKAVYTDSGTLRYRDYRDDLYAGFTGLWNDLPYLLKLKKRPASITMDDLVRILTAYVHGRVVA